jgi:DNA-directed RNA polymerase specialized sigma24 family protein
LTDDDEQAAADAFNHLHKSYRSFAQSALRRQFSECNAQDVENATQQAFLNLWQNRRRITVSGLPDWRGLLRKTVQNCYLDIMRARKPPLEPEAPLVEPGPGPDIIDAVERAARIRLLDHAANACWLGLDLHTPAEEHNRRLLAAQLFYQEGASVAEILDILNTSRPGARPLSHAAVTDWLEEAPVLRHLAYTSLYYSPLALTLHLLDLPGDTQAGILDAMIADDSLDCSVWPQQPKWTAHEIHAILWRYYRNASLHREPGIPQSDLSPAEIENLFVNCTSFFPFYTIMKSAILIYGDQVEELCGPAHPGLWRRLAFQYCYRDELAHRDIEERIAPASQQAAVPVSQTVLQGWLSAGRLLKALAKTWAELVKENDL